MPSALSFALLVALACLFLGGFGDGACFGGALRLQQREAQRQICLVLERQQFLAVGVDLADAIKKVAMKVSFSSYPDETTELCDLVIRPVDVRSVPGRDAGSALTPPLIPDR